MAETSKIEWTDATWNPITGCTMVSAGCTNCYAMGLAATRLRNHPSRAGLTRMTGGRAVWTGEVRLNELWLDQPLRWKRPRRIFVCAHGDLFHENVPDEWIDRVFAVMALAPQHTFQVLTKRPERARAYLSKLSDGPSEWRCKRLDYARLAVWPLPNVWLGTSVEDQTTADARIPDLLATPAALRFASAEPLLGPVDLTPWLDPENSCEGCDDGDGFGNRCGSTKIPRSEQCPWIRAVQTVTEHGPYNEDGLPSSVTSNVHTLDWVICGGESGPNARPMHPDWARSLRDQCQAAGVAFHFKQWGEWAPGTFECDERAEYYEGPVLYCEAEQGGDERSRYEGGVWCPVTHRFLRNWTDLPGDCLDGRKLPSARRIGKRAAGRLLDGRTWDEFPEVQHG